MSGIRGRAELLRDRAGALAALGSDRLEPELDRLLVGQGRIEARLTAALPAGSIREAEFSVFSQFGEDGILQHLIRHIPIANEVFVEFGVEDYRESNTRFLLVNDNWRGLIMDGGTAHVEFIEERGLRWRHHIDAITAFVDRDNINDLIGGAGVRGDIGILSIDIDGNDLWVLERIDVVSPRILVLEYNSVFGPEERVSVPYKADFVRSNEHFSHLYWGASLAALTEAAEAKGYALVGGNKAGNNAFYVRRDVLGSFPTQTVAEAYQEARFRESRDESGAMSYASGTRERLALFRDKALVDLASGSERTVADIYGV